MRTCRQKLQIGRTCRTEPTSKKFEDLTEPTDRKSPTNSMLEEPTDLQTRRTYRYRTQIATTPTDLETPRTYKYYTQTHQAYRLNTQASTT